MRVLIVEDQLKMGAALQRGLRDLGHEVELAATGAEGLARAQAAEFELVLMDAMLPDAEGPDLCRRLRAEGSSATLIVITALPAGPRAEIEADPSIDAVLAKPFELDDLQAVLARLAGRRARSTSEQRGPYALDLESGELSGPRAGARLSGKELELLRVLWCAEGREVTPAELALDAWGLELDAVGQVLDVYLARLARKLDEVGASSGALQTTPDGELRLDLA